MPSPIHALHENIFAGKHVGLFIWFIAEGFAELFDMHTLYGSTHHITKTSKPTSEESSSASSTDLSLLATSQGKYSTETP